MGEGPAAAPVLSDRFLGMAMGAMVAFGAVGFGFGSGFFLFFPDSEGGIMY